MLYYGIGILIIPLSFKLKLTMKFDLSIKMENTPNTISCDVVVKKKIFVNPVICEKNMIIIIFVLIN